MKRKEITRYFLLALLFVFITISVNVLQVLAENKQPNATEDYEGNVKPLGTLKAKVQAGDAKEALATLKAKIKARDEARAKLEKARDNLNTALKAIVNSGGKQTPAQTKQLEDLRAEIAEAEAALEEAEAEILAAFVALDKATAELPDGKDKDDLKRERSHLYSVAFPKKQVLAQNEQPNATASLSGVVTVEMKTDSGQPVNLTLPADVRPGDTISFSAETQDTATLSGAVFDIGGKEHKLLDRILTFVVPQAVGVALPIILKNSAGREIGRQQIAINKNPGTQPANVVPPRIGQTGQIVSIPTGTLGPYDGNAGNTRVAFTPQLMPTASINIPVIAESPHGTFARVPANAPTGPGKLSIEDMGSTETFPLNVLKLSLRADKLNLRRGQTTTLHAEITGMEGLAEDNHQVILNLKNLSPSVVRFRSTSSDSITTKITPNSQGAAAFNETLTGIKAGAFTINGLLKAVLGDAPSNPRDWVRKIAELKREAANQSENSKNQKELKKNADSLGKTAGNKDDWDKDGQPNDKERFRKLLEKEKEDLDKMQKRENEGSEAWKKIGEAKTAVDKAAKAAGVKLK